MNFTSVEKIADAVLYEGYMLYPYRPTAIKNRQRWNFGTLYPRAYAEAQRPAEPFRMVAECLLRGDAEAAAPTRLDLRIRFLQLADALPAPAKGEASIRETSSWQVGIERAADVCGILLSGLLTGDCTFKPSYDVVGGSAEQDAESPPLLGKKLEAQLVVNARAIARGVYRLRLELVNNTPLEHVTECSRNDALQQSFTSAHLILGVDGGSFVSQLDPPVELREAAAACQNVGGFPVLAGEESSQSMMLYSPIILYDYPQIAPESAGDFFDGTEMDEMLALRVLTLTDEEKQEMRNGDARGRMILERTEGLPQEHLMKLHGALRGLRPVGGER